MIPLQDCPPDTTCCSTITSMEDKLLDVVFEALASAVDPATCACFSRAISVGDEPHLGGDYVAVWQVGTAAAPPTTRGQGNMLLPRFRFRYSIKFHETGFPTIDAAARMPQYDAVTAASRIHTSRVEVVMRGLLGAMRQGRLVNAGSYQSFDGHTARPRRAGGVSDIFDLTLEHDWLPSVAAT